MDGHRKCIFLGTLGLLILTAVTRSVTKPDTAGAQALPWRFLGPKVSKTNF